MKRLILLILSLLFYAMSSGLHAYGSQQNMWQVLANSFKLKDYSSHPAVKEQIRWLLLHPNYLAALSQNSRPYIYFILEEIKRQNLPGELALMPMIESNYNPFAYSHAGAAGLWQLMPGTGSGLGVKQNWWYDGRRGVISSTMAALEYLRYLAQFFKGNWLHAIAAYDSGEGTVQRAINRNLQAHQATDFWSLSLPRETTAYLPRLLAMASIIKYPRYFGAQLPQQEYGAYFEAIPLENQIDLSHAAKLANIPYKELLKLNPGHNRWTTAPSHISNTLLLPISKVKTFIENLKNAPQKLKTAWNRYYVKNGDSLSTIANKNNSSIKLIKQINKLNSDLIKSGQKLLIPRARQLSAKNLSETKKQIEAIDRAQKVGPHQQVIHIVQNKETIQQIAAKYKVRQAEVIFWNQLKTTNLISGQKLLIWHKKTIQSGHFYVIQPGDNLGKIAKKHHLTLNGLLKLNPQMSSKNTIRPKQKIRVS